MRYPEQVQLPLVIAAIVMAAVGRVLIDLSVWPGVGYTIGIFGLALGISCLADALFEHDDGINRE